MRVRAKARVRARARVRVPVRTGQGQGTGGRSGRGRGTCMVKHSEIGGSGGGWLEPPRQWLGTQWVGLFLGVLSCPEPPGAP